MVISGLENFCAAAPALLPDNWGLLCNPAAINSCLEMAPEVLMRAFPGRIKAIFGPQHGFFAEKQDNMVESDDAVHPRYKLPVYSLYGQTRRPTGRMLKGLDVLLVDLPDMGCRVYTFFTTLVACMEEAAVHGLAVWVLDRPNPLGRGVDEGPCLPPELFSFVGPHNMPLRHSLTLGELALVVKHERKLDLDLRIIPVQGWQGGDFTTTGLPWVLPSPNLPTFDSALVYPGQVLLEGTTMSEGRGTTRPFEIFGMPGLDPWLLLEELKAGETDALAGALLRPLYFEPTFHKFAGQVCGGVQLHVTDNRAFRPLRATLAMLGAVNRRQPGLWEMKDPPYEYELEKRPLDLLLGDPQAADMLLAGAKASDLEARWQPGLSEWQERVRPYLLY